MDAMNEYPSNNDKLKTICNDLIRDNEICNDIFSHASDRTPEASSSTPAYILGPAFAGPISGNIIPHFPYNISVCPIYQRKNRESGRFNWGKWNEGITIDTWYKPNDKWIQWVQRMQGSCSEKWEMLGIKEAILISTSYISFHPELIAAALLFWSPSINAFVFPEGFMTPTIEDVFALVGLPPDGMDCHPDMFKDYRGSNPSSLRDAYGADDMSNYPPCSSCSYGTVVDAYCENSGPVGIEEEISFYHVWICKFLTCNTSKRNVKYFFCIAQCLVDDRKVALAPFFLGELYNTMFRYCEAPGSGLGGPMWFIQIWLYAYFSSLAPSPKISPKPITYGQVWMEGHYQGKIPTFDECFDVFYRISKEEGTQSLWPKRRDPQSFRPFSERKYGPREFREFDSLEPSASILASYLVARDLLVIRYQRYFFEAYTPVFASRQLGFIQAIPLPPFWTANDPWHTREQCTAKTWRKKMELGNSKMKNFNPVPYRVVCDATQNFDSWYGSYITGHNMPGDLSDAINSCYPNFIIHSTVSDCDELEKEDVNKVSPAKTTYIRKRKKLIDVVSAIPINKSTGMKEQIEKKKKKKKTTEANEVVFKSIETEMGNSRKMSRAKKRNLPRMIAAKKSSTPQIPSNSEGRNNSEELDELESSSEPCTEREEENCEEEDEYTSTATPATGLVSEIPVLQLCENVDKVIKKWDNAFERSASASTSAISSDQLMQSFRSLQEILSLPFTQVINNSSTKGRFVSLCNLLLPCMLKKDSNKWIPLQLFSKGFDTTASEFSTAKATLEQVRQLLEDHKVKFSNSDEFNCQLNAAKLKQAEASQVEKQTAQKIRDLKNQLDSATKKVADARECVEELLSQEKSIEEAHEAWSKSQAEIWTLREEAAYITESANFDWEEVKKVLQDIDLDR